MFLLKLRNSKPKGLSDDSDTFAPAVVPSHSLQVNGWRWFFFFHGRLRLDNPNGQDRPLRQRALGRSNNMKKHHHSNREVREHMDHMGTGEEGEPVVGSTFARHISKKKNYPPNKYTSHRTIINEAVTHRTSFSPKDLANRKMFKILFEFSNFFLRCLWSLGQKR